MTFLVLVPKEIQRDQVRAAAIQQLEEFARRHFGNPEKMWECSCRRRGREERARRVAWTFMPHEDAESKQIRRKLYKEVLEKNTDPLPVPDCLWCKGRGQVQPKVAARVTRVQVMESFWANAILTPEGWYQPSTEMRYGRAKWQSKLKELGCQYCDAWAIKVKAHRYVFKNTRVKAGFPASPGRKHPVTVVAL